MRIVFMGTPDFSVPCLHALQAAGHTVSAVFTQPDKAFGRKQLLVAPPVKQAAVALGLPVYQPTTLRDGTALEIVRANQPDLIVVVAYGKILPPELLKSAPYGCINVHASLLPKFRGASPIQSAILAGDSETGVTTMQMDEGLDTGDILLQSTVKIEKSDTAESLFEKLSKSGAQLLVETLELLVENTIVPRKQEEKNATYCTILTRESGKIDARKPALTIVNQVRGLYPWPAAYFEMQQKKYKVLSAELAEKTEATPGTLLIGKETVCIACGNGYSVSIIEIQPEGKKRMPIKAFINGLKQTEGLKLDAEPEATGC
ncbi:MAG: methionyl-tRNA formyltransferase [Clostridia bacterium]|nr:methionyl-tRNA formyltransferase [Clostridia bacterium]MBQ7289074.1 methionyl-tRNA formyltransferase [Clostridia bacterium]